MSDNQLVEALKAGSETAFHELITKYQEMIVVTSYGFLHNQEDAEDVAQEVFIQVFRSIGKFRGDAKLSTWLYRIAVNRSLNKIRSRKSKFFMALDEVFEIDNDASPRSPFDEVVNKERARILHEAIDKLPDNQKTAFVLSKFEGLANKRIADVMETTLSAVEALLNRSKKNLQKHLVEYYRKS